MKSLIKLPYRIPRIKEAHSVACPAYWKMAKRRANSPGHRRAVREFLKSIRKP